MSTTTRIIKSRNRARLKSLTLTLVRNATLLRRFQLTRKLIGIFFSKDRKDEVIEIEEEPETYIFHETGTEVPLMTQGEWMRGCPEGGEQSFLFSLYSELSEGECHCPHEGCTGTATRKKSDFFAIFVRHLSSVHFVRPVLTRIQPDFIQYIAHVRKVVRRTCSKCRKDYCFACGEPFQDKSQRPGAGAPQDLFHCSNLQGCLLGVGLSQLETMFVEQQQESGSKGKDGKTGKKRKVTAGTAALSSDDFDEDYPIPGGKRAKGGIGYAGNVQEDVRSALSFLRAIQPHRFAEYWSTRGASAAS